MAVVVAEFFVRLAEVGALLVAGAMFTLAVLYVAGGGMD